MTQTAVEQQATGWTADDSTFGARLALVRQKMRWGNVAQAATACGLPTESWRTWERDGVSPRNINDIAWTIAERTGCNYAWLADGSRLTTYVATRAGKGPEINSRYPQLAERTRPNGHPKRTTPDPATRRPGWKYPATAHRQPDHAIPAQRSRRES